ncbi:hypothetical protein [Streptomyces sp. NPDC049906]|uniref:hypothetical protein n=1 Tax=Streptomyces sp. NPDC049906 TaxID=3155656 RepID=UPI003423F096
MSTAQELVVAQQGSHQYVLTLDLPGRAVSTWTGTLTPGTRDTRHDIYLWLRDQITTETPAFAQGNVVFFSLEPNHL